MMIIEWSNCPCKHSRHQRQRRALELARFDCETSSSGTRQMDQNSCAGPMVRSLLHGVMLVRLNLILLEVNGIDLDIHKTSILTLNLRLFLF